MPLSDFKVFKANPPKSRLKMSVNGWIAEYNDARHVRLINEIVLLNGFDSLMSDSISIKGRPIDIKKDLGLMKVMSSGH